jgi:hypothetical protein
MSPPRARERASPRARQPRVYRRVIARLTRIRAQAEPGARLGRTLHFLLHEARGLSGRADYVAVEHVPPFEGDVAWFEVEKVERGEGHAWPWWRAVRQVEPPADA